MNTHVDTGKNDAFEGFVLLMRLLWGPLFRPILIANAIGYGWCVYSLLHCPDEALATTGSSQRTNPLSRR